MDYDYDIAISFAGEDRDYARELANEMESRDLDVFFDEFEDTNLWGRNLYEYLQTIYRDEAQFCIVLISMAYVQKVWPRHEFRSAQERVLFEDGYILPVLLEDVKLAGLHTTIGYLDAREHDIEELANLAVEKVNDALEAEDEDADEDDDDDA